jgi:hypothetical protein
MRPFALPMFAGHSETSFAVAGATHIPPSPPLGAAAWLVLLLDCVLLLDFVLLL